MSDTLNSIDHGERGYVCGTKCRFVAYEHDGELAKYLEETDEEALGCRVCPADRTPECGKTRCSTCCACGACLAGATHEP